ncbi:MAG: hypothetical protein Q4E75_03975 [bacterium]|nr:hypothetical protein [bacterium]
MNVIVSNKNQSLLENLGIDIIKELNGEYEVDEIIATFQNFFYQRMILDITAIKNYTDISNLQKLSMSLDMNKVILLLDNSELTNSPNFLSALVSMGIYNFTKNVEGIQYLYNTPNSYRDVAKFHNLTQPTQNQNNDNNTSKNNPQAQHLFSGSVQLPQNEVKSNRVIGVKNITKQSGATSLVYMMKKTLSKSYSVVAIEADKNDFTYFKDKDMVSTITSEIGSVINRYKNKDVILVDINNSIVAEGFCEDVLYLIEPTIIKLQKLMTFNASVLQTLKGKKVVLNKSLLSRNDVSTFEYESRLNIFYNMPPLNERSSDLKELNELLNKLGFNKI